MRKFLKTTYIAVITILLGTFLFPLQAQDQAGKPGNVIAQRTEVMKLMAGKMETIHDMLDGALHFKNEAFSHAVKELKEKSGAHLTALFPKGSTGEKSRAKTGIWGDWVSFKGYADALEKAAKGLEKTSAVAIKNGSIVKVQKQMSRGSYSGVNEAEKAKAMADMKIMQQSFIAIAKTCKGCHEKFKIPKKKAE